MDSGWKTNKAKTKLGKAAGTGDSTLPLHMNRIGSKLSQSGDRSFCRAGSQMLDFCWLRVPEKREVRERFLTYLSLPGQVLTEFVHQR